MRLLVPWFVKRWQSRNSIVPKHSIFEVMWGEKEFTIWKFTMYDWKPIHLHNALLISSCIERVTLSHPFNGFQIQALRKPMLLPQPTAGSGRTAWGIEALSVSHKATTYSWCGLQFVPWKEHRLQIRASRWWLCGCRAESPTRKGHAQKESPPALPPKSWGKPHGGVRGSEFWACLMRYEGGSEFWVVEVVLSKLLIRCFGVFRQAINMFRGEKK